MCRNIKLWNVYYKGTNENNGIPDEQMESDTKNLDGIIRDNITTRHGDIVNTSNCSIELSVSTAESGDYC